MFKKAFSLFFALTVFLSGSAFAAADFRVFSDTAKAAFAKTGQIVQNDIHFSKDYSKTITDICRNFVNGFASLTAFAEISSHTPVINNKIKTAVLTEGIYLSGSSLKKFFPGAGFALFSAAPAAVYSDNILFLALVLIFILWYIGLLRLFSGDFLFKKQIEI